MKQILIKAFDSLRVSLIALFFTLLLGCVSPNQQLARSAQQLHLYEQKVTGLEFEHSVYHNRFWGTPGQLHIYLAGDGKPFLQRYLVAADPTPRRLLVLELLAQDEAPAVYLGRPCYHDQARQQHCTPDLWTLRRYAPEIVNSMVAALQNLLSRYSYHEVVLVGYSGGGALAMLIAEQLPETIAVVTIAGNLDTRAWTDWHSYTPLIGSLNPASRPPLANHIVQLHLAGGQDENVKAAHIGAVAARQPCGIFKVIAAYDHACCWSQTWPSVLSQIKVLTQLR